MGLRKCFLLLITLLPYQIWGQQPVFQKSYQGTNGQDPSGMCRTAEGGFVMSGSNTILKVDSGGNPVWFKKYTDGPNGLYFGDVAGTKDSGFVACGITFNTNTNQGNIIVLKVDKNGAILWSKLLDDFVDQYRPLSIKNTPDDRIIVMGLFQGGYGNMFSLSCFNQSGSLLWSNKYGLGQMSWSGEVIACSDNGFLAVEGIRDATFANNAEFYAVKTDSLGNIQWGRIYWTDANGQSSDYASGVREYPGKHYLVVGESNTNNLLYLYLDSAGNAIWNRNYSFYSASNGLISLDRTKGNGSIAAYVNDKAPGLPILVKADSNATIEWVKSYGSTDDAFASVMENAGKNGYDAFGFIKLIINQNVYLNFHLVRTDSMGHTGCEQDIPYYEYPSPIYTETLELMNNGFTHSNASVQVTSFGVTQHLLCIEGNEETSVTGDLLIYPNPSSGKFILATPEETLQAGRWALAKVAILSALGELIYCSVISGERTEIDLSTYPKGIYFVNVIDEKGNSAVKKIVIE
jgi:hypothetical protein